MDWCPVPQSQYNCILNCFVPIKPGLSTSHISLHGKRNAGGLDQAELIHASVLGPA